MTDDERYLAALHAVQSGVAMEMERRLRHIVDDPHRAYKDLRVGVNSAHISELGLAKLLIAKGVFTQEEYAAAMADAAEEEQRAYEKRLSENLGVEIKLG